MSLSVPCQIFKALDRCEPPRKRDEVYVDLLSVELCLECTEPECFGGKGADSSGYYGPPRCAYEAVVMGRSAPRSHRGREQRQTVTLPGPDPDGVMRTWKCEVG